MVLVQVVTFVHVVLIHVRIVRFSQLAVICADINFTLFPQDSSIIKNMYGFVDRLLATVQIISIICMSL